MARRQMPKTGEPRKTRQTFAIDKLPQTFRDRILEMRVEWATWDQIEEDSAGWKWEELTEGQKKLFPERRIPHSTLHRWYDVMVRQKLEEIAKERQASLAIAEKLGAKGYEKLDESVKNAIADVVFGYAKNSNDPEKFRAALSELGWLLARNRQLDIAKMKADTEKLKIEEFVRRGEEATHDAAKKLGRGGKVTLEDINRIRHHTFGLPPIERGAAA